MFNVFTFNSLKEHKLGSVMFGITSDSGKLNHTLN